MPFIKSGSEIRVGEKVIAKAKPGKRAGEFTLHDTGVAEPVKVKTERVIKLTCEDGTEKPQSGNAPSDLVFYGLTRKQRKAWRVLAAKASTKECEINAPTLYYVTGGQSKAAVVKIAVEAIREHRR